MKILDNSKKKPNVEFKENLKPDTMDIFPDEDLLSSSWNAPDDLLDNIFSLDGESLNFLDDTLPDFDIDVQSSPQLSGLSSSSSDSGVSSDQAELDFEQQLSPFLIQNCNEEDCNEKSVQEDSTTQRNVSESLPVNEISNSSIDVITEDTFDLEDFEKNVVPGFINRNIVQAPVQLGKKRRLSQTPHAVVQPKVQKPIRVSVPTVVQRPQLVVTSQPQKPIKLGNLQFNSQTKVYSKPVECVAPQRKIIKVAPIAGNRQFSLLPVTLKDMKELKSIKIINAADLKNSQNIKIAAANLLSQSRRQEFTVQSHSDRFEDSGSDQSDEEDSDQTEQPQRGANGYPRLILSGEERRLLAKEGITLPSSYPLTKHEERELKRIRRKIRNKISAQDSRKRKKEYVDGLEERVKKCTVENQTLMKRIKILQTQNQSLTNQLKRLQKALSVATSGSGSTAAPATCLLVLLLSVALVALPAAREPRAPHSPHTAPDGTPAHTTRALLQAHKMPTEEMVIVDEGEFNMDELVTFNRPVSDHDYQSARNSDVTTLPSGYIDLPIDEDWPPKLKKRIKELKFNFDDGQDYIPPPYKEESYANPYKKHLKINDYFPKLDYGLLAKSLITTGQKLSQLVNIFPPVQNNKSMFVEEKNRTEIKM